MFFILMLQDTANKICMHSLLNMLILTLNTHTRYHWEIKKFYRKRSQLPFILCVLMVFPLNLGFFKRLFQSKFTNRFMRNKNVQLEKTLAINSGFQVCLKHIKRYKSTMEICHCLRISYMALLKLYKLKYLVQYITYFEISSIMIIATV